MLPLLPRISKAMGAEDFCALCHPNCNVDNAFFWRADAADGGDGGGRGGAPLDCGLLDWGGAAVMNVALVLQGALFAAEPEMLDAHAEPLLRAFAASYHEAGGPLLAHDELVLHTKFAKLFACLSNIGTVPLIFKNTPKQHWGEITDRRHERLAGASLQAFLTRSYALALSNACTAWATSGAFDAIREWASI